MGGAAVLRAIARLDVRPDGIVVESTFDSLLTTVKHRFDRMPVPSTPLAELLVFWGGWSAGIDGFDLDPCADAAHVRCPAIVIHGDQDSFVTSSEARAIFDRLGAWKRYHEFAGARHCGAKTADPERWNRALQELLGAAEERDGVR